MPENYRQEVGRGPVIAIEASPRQVDDERLAKIARDDDMVLAYVNNLQPLEPGFEDRLTRAIKDPKWRGLRLRPISAFDLDSAMLLNALSKLEGHGHVELGIRHPQRLGQFRKLCLALPNINFVLTHSGHPTLSAPFANFEYKLLSGLANVFVKLSPPQFADFTNAEICAGFAQHIKELQSVVSTEKLVYGSNWPVSVAPKKFKEWISTVLSNIDGDTEIVLSQTAARLYRID